MNTNIVQGIGLIGKAVWEITQPGQAGQAIQDFLAALGMLGLHSRIVGAMQAKGMGPPEATNT